eukprot:425638-Lingulodinium_polyedra.AAC.1
MRQGVAKGRYRTTIKRERKRDIATANIVNRAIARTAIRTNMKQEQTQQQSQEQRAARRARMG